MGWEEIFVGHMSDKGVISKVCKELIHSTAKIKKSIFFFFATPVACQSSQARNQISVIAVTRAIVVPVPGP